MITITQGDVVTISCTAQTGSGTLFDLTGATLTTAIKTGPGSIRTIPNSQHTINSDQVGSKGQYTISLLAADTNAIPAGISKEMVTTCSQNAGASIIAFHGKGQLTVLLATPDS